MMNNKPFSFVFLKFAVCFMLMGLAYRLFLSPFVRFSAVPDHTTDHTPPPSVSVDLRSNTGECDLFKGDWVEDEEGPFYTYETCNSIQTHQNCMKNGRPDTGYLHWRWKPRGCELPRFNPEKFLSLMRNKAMAFVGDSIMRNHVQSLLCILSQKERAEEVYHDEQYKSRRWHFPSNNFTLSVIWSPYLTEAIIFEDDEGVSTDIVRLHLDRLDKVWTEQFKNFDYVVVAGGKWFTKPAVYYENGKIVGCHRCGKKSNITDLGFYYAYRKALRSTLRFILRSNQQRVKVLFRTTTPDHFENGEWDSGGYCNRTAPFKEGEVEMGGMDGEMHRIEVEEYERALGMGSKNVGVVMRLFDTTFMSLLRPDGHPGKYRNPDPLAIQNDCLHWCLPGPIDFWNDLMMEMFFPVAIQKEEPYL